VDRVILLLSQVCIPSDLGIITMNVGRMEGLDTVVISECVSSQQQSEGRKDIHTLQNFACFIRGSFILKVYPFFSFFY